MEYPHLIEPSAKNYLFNTLKQCHDIRIHLYYYVLNIGIFLIFVVIVGYALYYCNKTKLSDYDKSQKMIRDQQYVLSKIRFHQEENKERNVSSLTNLPFIQG